MRRTLSWIVVVAAGAAVASCAGYRPKPIVEREVLRELQEIRLGALGPATPPAPSGMPRPVFDPTDGVVVDEAVAVALFLNPGLRAFRKERGVAEGEVVLPACCRTRARGDVAVHRELHEEPRHERLRRRPALVASTARRARREAARGGAPREGPSADRGRGVAAGGRRAQGARRPLGGSGAAAAGRRGPRASGARAAVSARQAGAR